MYGPVTSHRTKVHLYNRNTRRPALDLHLVQRWEQWWEQRHLGDARRDADGSFLSNLGLLGEGRIDQTRAGFGTDIYKQSFRDLGDGRRDWIAKSL
jgi:hypothetical protein